MEDMLVPGNSESCPPENCVAPTWFYNYDAESVQAWIQQKLGRHPQDIAAAIAGNAGQQIARACELYLLVRDGWRYNPYKVEIAREAFRLSYILTLKQTYCIPKALLLAGLARAIGIPARLGFGDVKNHLSSPRLIAYLRTDVFAYHGYAELWLDGKWVQATPAFDARLCQHMKVEPLEFDGRTNSLFQEYNSNGQAFMQYVRYHGVCYDLPHEWLIQGFRAAFPHISFTELIKGDLMQEV
jgi:transglutaminase-like putative cysteine protease